MDTHAQAFITATGISDGTIETAVDNLCIYLKKWGIWPKLVAIYPLVGGDATTHKYNLLNPLDTDAAKRLTFAGGWTHDSDGAQPNGTSGYADTHIDLNKELSPYSFNLTYYSRTNTIGGDDYVATGVGTPAIYIDCYSNNRIFVTVGEAPGNSLVINPVSGFNGTFSLNSIKPTSYKVFRNGVSIGESTGTRNHIYLPSIDPSNPRTLYIGANNHNGTTGQYFSNFQFSFFTVGLGLLDEEVEILNNAIVNFQTALSRNI